MKYQKDIRYRGKIQDDRHKICTIRRFNNDSVYFGWGVGDIGGGGERAVKGFHRSQQGSHMEKMPPPPLIISPKIQLVP